MTITLKRQTLSDGSFAYGVVLDDGYGQSIEIDCFDEKAAMKLMDSFLDHTNVADGGVVGYPGL